MMTQKEAIETLLPGIKITFDDVEEHEKFADEEQGEFQIEHYERCKKELEAYTVILGALDPELGTIEGLKKRCLEFVESEYGPGAGELPEPSNFEKELYEILNPWYKKKQEETGYSEDFKLEDEDNLILAKLNVEEGYKRVMIDEDPDDAEDPSEDDTFAFYPYRGRVQVVYNYDGDDGDFCSYPLKFQEKALEIIKKRMMEEWSE